MSGEVPAAASGPNAPGDGDGSGDWRLPGWRALARGLVVAGLCIAAVQFGGRLQLLHWLSHQATQARGAGVLGAIGGFGVIYLATTLLAPVIPLVMLSGWVWGFWGALVSLPAALASAVTVFLVARALGQSAAAQALRRHPKLARFVELGERGGILTVAALRISPLVPFSPSNAALGLTRLRLFELGVGTPLGMAPGALLYLWAGSLLPDPGAIERGEALSVFEGHGQVLVALAVGVAAVTAIAVLAAQHARRR